MSHSKITLLDRSGQHYYLKKVQDCTILSSGQERCIDFWLFAENGEIILPTFWEQLNQATLNQKIDFEIPDVKVIFIE